MGHWNCLVLEVRLVVIHDDHEEEEEREVAGSRVELYTGGDGIEEAISLRLLMKLFPGVSCFIERERVLVFCNKVPY